MKVLIKLGGTLLDHPEKLNSLSRQMVAVAEAHRLVVVHGGGKQVTRFLEERGISSRFVNGLRVSDESVIDAVTKVIAGSVNKQLVAALIAAGRPALGISGVDGQLTCADQLDPALEFVGRPTRSNGALLDLLVNAGYLPVIACLAGDAMGRIFNVNADQMAVSCALGWRAERLIFLTDVSGVKDAAGGLLPKLGATDVRRLIETGVAHGGMQAKLEAAMAAVEGGVPVTIALGSEPDVALRLLSDEQLGTQLLSQPAVSREVSA